MYQTVDLHNNLKYIRIEQSKKGAEITVEEPLIVELNDPLICLVLGGGVEEAVAVGLGSVATARTSRRLRLETLSREEVLVEENVRRRGSMPQ